MSGAYFLRTVAVEVAVGRVGADQVELGVHAQLVVPRAYPARRPGSPCCTASSRPTSRGPEGPAAAAAWRILSASGGVKLRTTPPPSPAACTAFSATELASWIGTFSLRLRSGCPRPWRAARSRPRCTRCPARSTGRRTSFLTPWRIRYCVAPSDAVARAHVDRRDVRRAVALGRDAGADHVEALRLVVLVVDGALDDARCCRRCRAPSRSRSASSPARPTWPGSVCSVSTT